MKEIPPVDARQGRNGKQMRNVLMISLILVAIVWFGVEIYGSYISKSENTLNSNSQSSESLPPKP